MITSLFSGGSNPLKSIYGSSKQLFVASKVSYRCCDIGQTCIGKDVKMTYYPRIELFPLSSLSSDNTNYKNDIQLFHQLFDE